ncbi:ParM/StbA family protein [soil metagenome]
MYLLSKGRLKNIPIFQFHINNNMKISTINFPSVFETVFGNTENSAKDLLNGLKIKKGDTWYLAGNLARKGAVNPGRVVNASPQEEDFDILFKAAIVNVLEKVQQPFAITIGFPFSTYNVYKTAAEQYLAKRHFIVDYDTRTFNIKGSLKKNTFDVDVYDVIPEIVGGIIGLKKTLPNAANENFIALSFGFGTMEGAMATTDGLVHRTCFSSHGLRYVIGNLMRELSQKHYLEMKNEHQIDEAFIKGSIFTNRKRIDLQDLRKELLTQYYKQVVSPLLRKHFTDADLESCDKIYLIGGGANYKELSNAVAEEFAGFIPVEVPQYPENIISCGYLYNSLRISDTKEARSIGIDLGNATTAISYFENSAI